MRLQKYLAHNGIASRRAIERMIENGEIVVNGQRAKLGDTVSGTEKIAINGKVVSHDTVEEKVIFAFYKPRGVECTMSSTEDNKCIGDYNFGPVRVYPVGRLDKESHGLVIMTNDGELANQLTHPSFEHEKEYTLLVDKKITPRHITRLSNGTIIINEKTVNPAVVDQLSDEKLRITLTEGRNRQIRKMCDAVGLTVRDLKRVRVARVELENLQPGHFRKIQEV